MKSQIVEVTNGPNNWGKFLIAQFDRAEWSHQSQISPGYLLPQIGWSPSLATKTVWVLDLQTREGACFFLNGQGGAKFDLDKHKVWVCPMFEPFLNWLYAHWEGIENLPPHVDLPDAPFSFSGYRREGKSDKPDSISLGQEWVTKVTNEPEP